MIHSTLVVRDIVLNKLINQEGEKSPSINYIRMNVTKQYILIKEYPGSPKLGTIITQSKAGCDYTESTRPNVYLSVTQIENSPEFWQMLKYRVTQIKNQTFGIFTLTNTIANGYYVYTNPGGKIGNGYVTMEEIYRGDTKNNSIHQVVRIEDGAVFTVGQTTNRGVITEIKLSSSALTSGVLVRFAHTLSVDLAAVLTISKEFALQTRVKLYTTEDGVDIYEGTKCFSVDEDYEIHGPQKYTNPKSNLKFFSTHVAAAAWVRDNQPKPVFTSEDGVKIYPGMSYYMVDTRYNVKADAATARPNQVLYVYNKRFSTETLAEAYLDKVRVLFTFKGKEYRKGDVIWFEMFGQPGTVRKGVIDNYSFNLEWFELTHKTASFRVFSTEAEAKGWINMTRNKFTGQEFFDQLAVQLTNQVQKKLLFEVVATAVSALSKK